MLMITIVTIFGALNAQASEKRCDIREMIETTEVSSAMNKMKEDFRTSVISSLQRYGFPGFNPSKVAIHYALAPVGKPRKRVLNTAFAQLAATATLEDGNQITVSAGTIPVRSEYSGSTDFDHYGRVSRVHHECVFRVGFAFYWMFKNEQTGYMNFLDAFETTSPFEIQPISVPAGEIGV